ncbi:MAG TPA: CBS domain-containing protein [Candidatus Thermoplasmatota archaeon]|nr:CBS domain-containing protein [Candidatus Thermoplasmatota archaeon]
MSENHTAISTLHHLTVKDILEPITIKDIYVEKSENIEHVFLLFETKQHIWVVDDKISLHVVGVITESDTIQLLAPPYTPIQSYDKPTLQSFQYGLPILVEEIMSKQPITAHTEETIADVIMKMKQHQIKQLPIVDDSERLIGEITLHRLIQEYTTQQKEMNQKKT